MGGVGRFQQYHGGIKLFKDLRNIDETLDSKHNLQLLFVWLVTKCTRITVEDWESMWCDIIINLDIIKYEGDTTELKPGKINYLCSAILDWCMYCTI